MSVIRPVPGHAVVRLVGELDLASRDQIEADLLSIGDATVDADLTAVTFLDCAGYRAIANARRSLGAVGRQLDIVNATGQPRRLLELIATIDARLQP